MQFLSLQPFVPSGSDYEGAKKLFEALGFTLAWDAAGCTGFERDACKFILQQYDHKIFAENFMLTVNVDDVAAFREMVIEKQLPEKFGIKVSTIINQPYGKEVNVIDMAGVCWHFVE